MGILDSFQQQEEQCPHTGMYIIHKDLGDKVVEFCVFTGCGYKKFYTGKEKRAWQKKLKQLNR